MAHRVLPRVRMLFPCDDAVLRASDNKWVLTNPWAVVALPPGAHFPFDLQEMWLYAQLTDGVGESDLHVKMLLVQADDSRKAIHRGEPRRLEFPAGQQLQVFDTVFHMTNVPFDKPGVYEFQVWANYVELQGQTAQIRVLDARDKP